MNVTHDPEFLDFSPTVWSQNTIYSYLILELKILIEVHVTINGEQLCGNLGPVL